MNGKRPSAAFVGADRRQFLSLGASFLGAGILLFKSLLSAFASNGNVSDATALQRQFDKLFLKLLNQTKLLERAKGVREGQILFSPFAPGVERAPIRARPSKTDISSRATDLLVACEVTSKTAYVRKYQRPTWPRGQSGVTIGIGYDIGYVTSSWLKDDWNGYLTDEQVQALAVACGATGARARDLNQTLQAVVIEWDKAYRQFIERVQPRWVGETEASLPNTSLLSAESLGALVSLVYNRGPSFSTPHVPERDPLDRYREMRAIKSHMAQKAFDRIPDEIRSMKRIWRGNPDMRGLLARRELEAVLFEAGLVSKLQSSVPKAGNKQ